VQIAGDTDLENDETFQVSLSNPNSVAGVTFGTNNPTVSTILNDDQEVSIAATDADKAEGNAGTTPFTFTVSRTGFLGSVLGVNYDVTGTGATRPMPMILVEPLLMERSASLPMKAVKSSRLM
jgi:hypothetical protein